MNDQEFEKVYEEARQKALKKYLTKNTSQEISNEFKGLKNSTESLEDLVSALPALTLKASADFAAVQEKIQHDIIKELFFHFQKHD